MKFCKNVLPLSLALVMTLALLSMPAFAARQGELVVPCQYYSVEQFRSGFAKVSKNDEYGFVDTAGNEFLMGKYDSVSGFTDLGIAPVGMRAGSSGYRWGLIDTTGTLVVPCEYEATHVTRFDGGLVAWKRNGKYGLIGANGRAVTPFQYDGLDGRLDYIRVSIGDKYGLLDLSGKEAVPCVYDSVVPAGSYVSTDGYAKEGMAQVMLNGKYGFANTSTGELAVPCKYDRVSNFSGGYAAVGIAVGESSQAGIPECKWGIVNTSGQEVVPCQYSSSYSLPSVNDGLLVVRQNDKWGFVNTANKLVVPYKYDAAAEFSNGYAMVWQNEKCGYIDVTGKEIVPCQYEFTQGFHDGLAVLWKNGKRGYVDTTGKIVIPLQYYSASEFSEGFAAVKKTENGKYGYINTAGKAITPFQYDDAWAFKDGAALVERNGKLGYINTSGQEIIPCIYDIMSGGFAPNRYGNLVQLWLKGKYALVSTVTGQAVTDFEYYDMCNAHGDYISVQLLSGWGAVYTGAESTPANPTVPAVPAPTAYSTPQSILIDGTPVQFTTYAIVDKTGGVTNYVKLRDLAHMLNGTTAQFSVGWDGTISLAAGQPYTPNGSEMATPFSGNRTYTANRAKVFVNGQEAQLEAIVLTDDQGNAYTYFKLRDLGQALGFNVSWDSVRGVYLETDRPYAG